MAEAVSSGDWTSGIKIGDIVTCEVVKHAPFGVFVCVSEKLDGIIERIQMERDGYKTPNEFPPVGSTVRGEVIGFREWSHQVEVALPPKSVGQEKQ